MIRSLLTVLSIFASTPAAAQSVAMSHQTCLDSWGAFAQEIGAAGQGRPSSAADGFCAISNVSVDQDKVGIGFDRLEWRGTGLARFVDDGLPPTSLELRAKSIRFQGPDLAGIPAQGLLPLDIEFAGAWDQTAQQVVVHHLIINPPGEGQLTIEALLTGVDLSTEDSIQRSRSIMRVRTLVVEVASVPLVKTFMDSVFGPLSPRELEQLPSATVEPDDVAKLQDALAGNKETLRLILVAPDGVSITQLANTLASANDGGRRMVDRLLPGARIAVQ